MAERAALVAAGLAEAGCDVVAVAPDAADLTRRVRESRAEVIVCDLDDPGRDALESMRVLNRDEPRPVVLFANRGEPEQIGAALEAGGAAYVVEGLTRNRVRPVIEVDIRRFRAHQALREELETTRHAGRPQGDRRRQGAVDGDPPAQGAGSLPATPPHGHGPRRPLSRGHAGCSGHELGDYERCCAHCRLSCLE